MESRKKVKTNIGPKIVKARAEAVVEYTSVAQIFPKESLGQNKCDKNLEIQNPQQEKVQI